MFPPRYWQRKKLLTYFGRNVNIGIIDKGTWRVTGFITFFWSRRRQGTWTQLSRFLYKSWKRMIYVNLSSDRSFYNVFIFIHALWKCLLNNGHSSCGVLVVSCTQANILLRTWKENSEFCCIDEAIHVQQRMGFMNNLLSVKKGKNSTIY